MPYFPAPFIGWFVSGVVKYFVNHIRFGQEARKRSGNGGFPSTHTTAMTTTTVLIGINEGFLSSVFGIAVAITYIVVIDAIGLRRHVGQDAKTLNQITNHQPNKLRESMGHTPTEVLGGLFLGVGLAFILNYLWI